MFSTYLQGSGSERKSDMSFHPEYQEAMLHDLDPDNSALIDVTDV